MEHLFHHRWHGHRGHLRHLHRIKVETLQVI